MGYDYSLLRRVGPGPMASWPAEDPEPIGEFEHVRAKLDEYFGRIDWRRSEDTWFGRAMDESRYAEIQISPEDGQVRFITLSRIERADVEAVCAILGVVGLDPAMRMYASETGTWTEQR